MLSVESPASNIGIRMKTPIHRITFRLGIGIGEVIITATTDNSIYTSAMSIRTDETDKRKDEKC